MTIEFQTPRGQVKEWIMMYLMRKLMEFYAKVEQISRAQVYLREQPGSQKSCAIDITIYGDSLFVNRTAATFEEASLYTLAEVEEKLKEIQKRPATEVVSTVRV